MDGEVGRGLTVPWREGLETLETLRLGVNGNLDRRTVLRRGLEGVLTRVVTARGELVAVGVGELERLAIGAGESV